jgi:putative spermidine/putrescine transport system permease protein
MSTSEKATHGIFTPATTIVTLIFLTIPLVILAVQSFTSDPDLQFPPQGFGVRWYRYLVDSQAWRSSAGLSLLLAAIVTPSAVLIGTAAAFALDRGPKNIAKFFYVLLLAPMLLPHLVLALGMLRVALFAGIEDTLTVLVLAHITVAIPYVIVTVAASLKIVQRDREEAAASLGASPARVFYYVTLPAILPGVLAGSIFAFIASFDEFILTFFLTTFQKTLPLQVFSTLSFQVEPSIAAASTLALAITVLLTALVLSRGQIVANGTIVK